MFSIQIHFLILNINNVFCKREKRLEQEHDLMNRQMELLQQQLRQRTEEALQQRNDHSCTVLSLQTELNHKLHEVSEI